MPRISRKERRSERCQVRRQQRFDRGRVLHFWDIKESGPSKISGGCGVSVSEEVCGSRRKRCKRQQRPCQRQFWRLLVQNRTANLWGIIKLSPSGEPKPTAFTIQKP
ncbi:hypothetical protein KCP71_17940 [Salmonella enterica subsp. enterica]|nr:hypothetical protein KCP71_17940 [Salmonella enterica subsp. enterica]